MSTPTHLFYHSFWWNIYYPSSSHQFVLRPKFGSLIHGLIHPISVLYAINNFLIILWIWVGLPQPSILGLLWCVYTYLLTFWVSIFYIVPIVVNTQIHKMIFMMYLHPLQKMLFSCNSRTVTCSSWTSTLQTSRYCINIVLSKMGVYTRANIIIVDLTHVDLPSQASKTWGFATSKAIQSNKWNHQDHHSRDQFFP